MEHGGEGGARWRSMADEGQRGRCEARLYVVYLSELASHSRACARLWWPWRVTGPVPLGPACEGTAGQNCPRPRFPRDPQPHVQERAPGQLRSLPWSALVSLRVAFQTCRGPPCLRASSVSPRGRAPLHGLFGGCWFLLRTFLWFSWSKR